MTQALPPRPDISPGDPGPPSRAGAPGAALARPTWRTWEAIAAYVVAQLLAGVVTLPILRAVQPPGDAKLLAANLGNVVVCALLLLWLRVAHAGWRDAMGFPDRPWREIRAGFVFGVGLYPVVTLTVGVLLSVLLRAVTGEAVRTPPQVPEDLTAVGITATGVFALVAAPVLEELFFRGLLFRSLRDRYGFGVGAAGSALAFGLVHYIPAPWASSLLLVALMVGTGLALAYLYERRGTIVAPIVAHAAFNLIGLVVILGG